MPLALCLSLLAGAGTGCQRPAVGGEPSPFYTTASVARWIERDHPSLEPDGSFVVGRVEASSTWRSETRYLTRLTGDLEVAPGRQATFHRDLHARIEDDLRDLGLVVTHDDESVAGGTLTLGYRGADVTGWFSLAGVRTGERSYRVEIVITESPVRAGNTLD